MAIWVIKDGQREGPYEEADVRELIYEGTYGDADLAIRDGQYHWSTLGEVLGKVRPAYETALMDQQAPADEELLAGEQSGHFSETPSSNGEMTAAAFSASQAATQDPPALPSQETEVASSAVAKAPVAQPAAVVPARPATPVAIVDFQMPFTSMVFFMVKWAFAAVPALMILGTIIGLFWIGIAMILAAVASH